MEKTLEMALGTSVRFLEEQGYRYAIIGGIALAQWGVVRVTRDVDFKVLVPDVDYNAIRSTLKKTFPKISHLDTPINPLIVAVTINDVNVDFLLALPGYEELIIERAVRRNLNGLSVWICSAEDLIIQKVVAGRGKDWSDVEALLIERWGKLDEDYIRDWLGQFAEALEIPELLADFDQLRMNVAKLF